MENVTNGDILKAINEFRQEAKNSFVSIDRYLPVERLVYGMAGVVLIAVVTAVVALVMNKTGVQAKW